jgi:hypothetical protein
VSTAECSSCDVLAVSRILVIMLVDTNISEELPASIFRAVLQQLRGVNREDHKPEVHI